MVAVIWFLVTIAKNIHAGKYRVFWFVFKGAGSKGNDKECEERIYRIGENLGPLLLWEGINNKKL